MQINFKEIYIYTDIARTKAVVVDTRHQLAEGIYHNAQGVAALSLALKIHNSQGAEEYTADEINIIMRYAEQQCTPMFIAALRDTINGKEGEG